MKEAREALGGIEEWLRRLRETAAGQIDNGKIDLQFGRQFEEALDDDLNISAALGFLFELIRETNRTMDRNKLDASSARAWLNWWERVNNVLDLETENEVVLSAEVAQLAKDRENARCEKNWKQSDELRDRISALGWEVRDTNDGQKLTPRMGSG